MEAGEYLDDLRDRSRALMLIAEDQLNADIPTCPGWTVADLIAHVGGTWGWAATTVRTGVRSDRPAIGDADLLEWAERQRSEVLEVLASADPDSNCWTFGLPRSRLFWFRRQALETAIHAWDLQRAVACPEPIRADLASDGIDELLAVMLPRIVKQDPDKWTGQSLHLHRTDGDGEWMIRLGPGTTVAAERAHGKGDVAIRGTASSLYLWTLNRLDPSDLEVFGDHHIADMWASSVKL